MIDNMVTVECVWCGKPTPMLGTKMCDGCWELDLRIRIDLPMAKKMIAFYEENKHKI